MKELDFDVIISGAGPAGCSTAISLADTGLKVAIIDKASFPREKICGDGITIDSLNQLNKLSPRLSKTIESFENKFKVNGCVFTSPKGYLYHVKGANHKWPYIIQRSLFDHELLKECGHYNNIQVMEGTKVTACSISDDQVEITTSNGKFTSKMLVGADGVNSLIAKMVNPNKVADTLYGVSVRAYYSNMKDMGHKDAMEIHYLKELIPGYLWIFPGHNNINNVGICVDEKMIKKKGLKLGELFKQILINNPLFKDKFADAVQEGDIKAYRLPLFNRYKKIYGNRVLLVGDAANMVNTMSGEGVSTALRTGRFAAEHILNCFAKNNFSKEFNKNYYKKVKRKMFPELTTYTILAYLNKKQWFSNYALKDKSLLNRLIKKYV